MVALVPVLPLCTGAGAAPVRWWWPADLQGPATGRQAFTSATSQPGRHSPRSPARHSPRPPGIHLGHQPGSHLGHQAFTSATSQAGIHLGHGQPGRCQESRQADRGTGEPGSDREWLALVSAPAGRQGHHRGTDRRGQDLRRQGKWCRGSAEWRLYGPPRPQKAAKGAHIQPGRHGGPAGAHRAQSGQEATGHTIASTSTSTSRSPGPRTGRGQGVGV